MSMIEVGIDSGFVEMDEGLLIIYPKRVMNTAMLHQTIEEAINEGFCPQSEVTYNKPIIMKKSNIIDMTEVVVKLFALSSRYGVNLKLQTFTENGTVEIHFIYKNVSVTKNFDIDLLCAMEKDYLTGWFEGTLQKIDEKENVKDASR